MKKELLTAVEAAEILGVSRGAISYHLKKGNLIIKDGAITAKSVEYLKHNRRKGGRPLGSFKK